MYKKSNKFVLGNGKFQEKYKDMPKLEEGEKKKTVLVTGGAGFLGYHISQRLRNKYNLIFLDIADFIKDEYPKGSKLYDTDIRDKKGMENILKENKIDLIIHAAAALPLWSKKDIFSTNVQGSKNVFDLALKYKIPRVTYISSTAVYGVPKVHPLYETSELIGVGNYGISKIEAEKVALQYRKKGLILPVLRPKTFIGTARLGVFQLLYDWVAEGKKIPVIGNAENEYQLLEVDDLVDAIDLTLTLPKSKVNDTFNVGAETFGKVKDFLGGFFKYAKTGSKIMKTPAGFTKATLATLEFFKLSPLYKWVYGTADKDSFVSIDKAKKQLGWKPKYSNLDALKRSYDWYLAHKDSLSQGSGVTHRIKWKEGALSLVKKFM